MIIDNVIKIAQLGKETCRAIGAKLGLSKSSVNRSQQKINKRSHIEGATFFETELILTVCIFQQLIDIKVVNSYYNE